MRTLNLGILAHVDAGKTSLTERLLHSAGVVDEVGNVDDGSTRTDSTALERQRGITIRSAVVSFVVGDVAVNLIDTPGHPDFIAEVERALGVLDGAVLVISAVEGVQAQTRLLMRTLRRLRIPTLVFVNKIDREGRGTKTCCATSPQRWRAGAFRWERPSTWELPPHATRPSVPRTGTSPRPCWNCSPSTTMRCWPPTSTASRRFPTRGCGASSRRRHRGCWCTRSSSARRSRVRASRTSCRGWRSCCPRPAVMRTAPCPARCSRPSANRAGTRSPTCACSPGRCACGRRCASAARSTR
ncbi:GTP-binding protein [Saccharopolyspora spinosporotrichia]